MKTKKLLRWIILGAIIFALFQAMREGGWATILTVFGVWFLDHWGDNDE